MTVSSSTNKAGPYAGAGLPGPFTVPFRFLSASHLQVIKTSAAGLNTTLTLTTDYTVSGVGAQTGSVTLTAPLAVGERLTIVRNVPFTQLADYVNNDAFPADSHEDALDLLTMQTQQLKERVDAALALSPTAQGVSATLPPPAAGNVIGWDSTASALRNIDPATLASIVAYSNRRTLVANGGLANYTLAVDPGNVNNTLVAVGGVVQTPGVDYTVSGVTLTPVGGPWPAGTGNVVIVYGQALPVGTQDADNVNFIQSGTNAVARTAQSKLRDVVSVRDFGAKGDALTDDTAAIQAAANHAMAIRGELFFPANDTGAYYKITAPIVFTSALHIRGVGPQAVTLFGTGLAASTYVFDFNCLAANVVEQITLEGCTIRSNNQVPNGLRLKNVANVLIKDVRLYNLANGIVIEGTRCYTHSFEQLNSTQISGNVVVWASGFTGGGQFIFDGCTFFGNIGVYCPSTAFLDNLSFTGCNWEQCTSNSMVLYGTVGGVSVTGSRTEGCDGVDFIFRPALAAEYIGGINIAGNCFSASDASAAARMRIGGDAGKVRGFNIAGNVVTHGADSFSGALVELNGDGESGLVAGNFLRGTTCAAVNTQRAGVVVFGNENLAGKLNEWWGSNRIVTGTFTATATGMTTSPTGTAKYSVINGTVTLDVPFITGTSNATTFTLTGAPAAIAPAADKDMICRVQDNGTVTTGMLRVKTTGVLELFASVAGNAFSAIGTKATYPTSVSYTLL